MTLRNHARRPRRGIAAIRRSASKLRSPSPRAAIVGGCALALIAAPIALASAGAAHSNHSTRTAHAAGTEAAGGFPLRGAIHNPASSAFFRTTGIFANSANWTTRVENLGTGGASINACHAPAGGVACLDAYNLSGGLAFMVNATGASGGEILLQNPSSAPFTTNAHGVASGLNANYLQGKQASEFQLANQPAANSDELGGQPPSSYVSTGQLLFADVLAGPKLQEGSGGATSVKQLGSSYTITFAAANISKCAYTVSPTGAALNSGQLGVESDSSNTSAVIVNAPTGFSAGFDLQVVC